jgi:hypothetical protein
MILGLVYLTFVTLFIALVIFGTCFWRAQSPSACATIGPSVHAPNHRYRIGRRRWPRRWHRKALTSAASVASNYIILISQTGSCRTAPVLIR